MGPTWLRRGLQRNLGHTKVLTPCQTVKKKVNAKKAINVANVKGAFAPIAAAA